MTTDTQSGGERTDPPLLPDGGQTSASKQRRLAPQDRERQILEAAISFFAKHGFEASTRDLARELNITQPLLYRYFPNKEALVQRVEEVFAQQWNPLWETWLVDRSRPLRERLQMFLKDYVHFVLHSDWVRIFIYAGLSGSGINQTYLNRMRERHFLPIARELRHEYGIPEPRSLEEEDDEVELVWGMHASVFYIGIRKWVYDMPPPSNLDAMIDLKIDTFLEGTSTVLRKQRATKARKS